MTGEVGRERLAAFHAGLNTSQCMAHAQGGFLAMHTARLTVYGIRYPIDTNHKGSDRGYVRKVEIQLD